MRVAIVATHPIQYYTPWFQSIAAQKDVEIKVYYALLPDRQQQAIGFGDAFSWDVPLLEGYEWELIPNKRKSPNLQGFFRSSTPAIYSLLRRNRPDAVIITGWQALPLLQALLACIRLGIPRIVRGESNGLRPRPMAVRVSHRQLLKSFNAFLTIGKLNRAFYRQYNIPEERLFRCPYFVDNRRFAEQLSKDSLERESLRAGWNIPPGHTCFLYAGKLEPKKRVLDLFQAIDRARAVNPSIHLLVAGSGELTEEARRYAHGCGLPVTFAGFLNQTEITRAYAASDCLVLPSDYGETWGLVVNEAMACGLPAIVSDRAGCGPDLIEDGVNGGMFACGDVNALSQRIRQFASDPQKLADMGQQAKRRINDYSVEQAVEGTMRALNYVTTHRPVTKRNKQMSDRLRPPAKECSLPFAGRASFVFRPLSSPRVLHVIPSLSPNDGGPSFAMRLIARGLNQAGVFVDVAATTDSKALIDCELVGLQTRNGVNHFYFRRQTSLYKISLSLSRWLSEHIHDYDLVHIHALFSYSSYAAANIAKRNGVPYIVRPLGVLNRWGMENRRKFLKKISFRFIEKPILRDAAAVHFTSHQERLEAQEAGVDTESVVIPLAVDLAGVSESASAESFFQKFSQARGRKIILFLSRIDPKKGLELLLTAFSELLIDERQSTNSNERPLLVIIGNGADGFVEQLKRMATDLGIEKDVLWAGFLQGPDKCSALKAASLFVLPSYSENFGIAAVEAMAASLPCVISDQVGVAADAQDYDAALVVKCEPGSLKLALRRLLENPELQRCLGANARRLVEERFSLEAMTASLVKLYGRVLSGNIPELAPMTTRSSTPLETSSRIVHELEDFITNRN